MNLAPIVLFVYNRPWHTKQTLNALMKNELADKSILYVVSDGPTSEATMIDKERIVEVRNLIKNIKWPYKKYIYEENKNKGLGNIIIEYVTKLIKKYGRLIVLEDDIVTSVGFLKYMNDALSLYASEEKVMHISAYWFPTKNAKKLPNTFFYNTASCWGWGTWERSWNKLIIDTDYLKKKILKDKKYIYKFNIEGSADFSLQLQKNITGEINTWAIKWYSSLFLNNGFSLHPNRSLVRNIGMDGTGINFNNSNSKEYYNNSLVNYVKVEKIKIKESVTSRKQMKQFYKRRDSKMFLIKDILRRIIPSKYKQLLKNVILKQPYDEYNYLINKPRYEKLEINLKGKKIKIPDAASFRFMYNEIFRKEIYKFYTSNEKPYIIDAGANVGLSVIYFKLLYPKSEIVAFEPDYNIFKILNYNIENFEFNDVRTINMGLWDSEKTLQFISEGADAGRIVTKNTKKSNTSVKVISLKSFIKNKTVDLLKIDIEGSEDVVIRDIKDLLCNVDRIFIEYHSFINKKQTLNEIINILTETNFRIYINQEGVQSNQPFVKINDYQSMDLQLNIYGFKK